MFVSILCLEFRKSVNQEKGIILGHKSRDKEQCQNNRKGEGKDGSWSKFKDIKYCLSQKTYFLFLKGDGIRKNSGSKFKAIVLCVLLINSMRLNFFSWTKFFIWLLQIFFKTFQPFISRDISYRSDAGKELKMTFHQMV